VWGSGVVDPEMAESGMNAGELERLFMKLS